MDQIVPFSHTGRTSQTHPLVAFVISKAFLHPHTSSTFRRTLLARNFLWRESQ